MYAKPMLELEIAPAELAREMAADPEGILLLDVREPWEWRIAHIVGSKPIPMNEIPARAFEELDPEARLVAVCHAGVRSMKVAAWLRNQGFEKAQSLRGGIDAWSCQVDSCLPRY